MERKEDVRKKVDAAFDLVNEMQQEFTKRPVLTGL